MRLTHLHTTHLRARWARRAIAGKLAVVISTVIFLSGLAAPVAFHPGPVIRDFGQIADIPDAPTMPRNVVFKVAFDVATAAPANALNRSFDAAARLINMHAAAGVPIKNTQVAIVVHGVAHRDLLRGSPNAKLVAALLKAGVRIELCGQSAAHYGIQGADLVPGVRMALSAMTAHAVLRTQGYGLNPF